MKKLPNKLSDLILVAINDLESVEANPKYKVRMDVWHQPMKAKQICSVCFAGSVMANTLECDPSEKFAAEADTSAWLERDVNGFDKETADKLASLNLVREGLIIDAIKEFYGYGFTIPEAVKSALREVRTSTYSGNLYLADVNWPVVDYKSNPEKFKSQMIDIAAYLAVEGL